MNKTPNSLKTKNKKRNMDGKIIINKSKFIYDTARKTCFKCGNSNHLALDCMKNKKEVKNVSN